MKKILVVLLLLAVAAGVFFCLPGCGKKAPPLRPAVEAERLLSAYLERERREFAAKQPDCRYFRLKDNRIVGFSAPEVKFYPTRDGYQFNCARHYRYREFYCTATGLTVTEPVAGKRGYASAELTFDITRRTFENGGESGVVLAGVILRRYPFVDGGKLTEMQNALRGELQSALPAENFELKALAGRSRRPTVRTRRLTVPVEYDPARGKWTLKDNAPEVKITEAPEWEDEDRFLPEEMNSGLSARKFTPFDGVWLRAGDVENAKKQNAGQVFFKDIWVALAEVQNAEKRLTEYIDTAKEIYFSNVTSPDDGGKIDAALSTLLDRLFLVREDAGVYADGRRLAELLADYELRRRYFQDFADSGGRLMDKVAEWKRERKWKALDFGAKKDGVKTFLVNLQLENARRMTLLTVFRNSFQNMPGNTSVREADILAREYRMPQGKFRQTLFGYVSLLQLANGIIPRKLSQTVSKDFMNKFTTPCTKCGGGGDFQCEYCHGTKICPICHGTGRRMVANLSKLTNHIEYNISYSEAPCQKVCPYCAAGSLHRSNGCRSCSGQGFFIKRALVAAGIKEYELRLTDALDTELPRLEKHGLALKNCINSL